MKKINRIITRKNPNLECGFFAALLAYLVRARINLGITTGNLVWEFISTASGEIKTDEQTICFNVGGGQFDQHGKEENKSLCKMCSLNFVEGQYPFLKGRLWLREVFRLVQNNDVYGERISRHPFNLREIMNGLAYVKDNEPMLILDWLTLAFCGVFENLKDGQDIKKVFDPQILVKGVEKYEPSQKAWFEELLQLGIGVIKKHNAWAEKAIAVAEEKNYFEEVFVPSVGKTVKVISVFCDSIKTGPVARSHGYDLVIQYNSDGHCQIHGGYIKSDGIKKWLDLSCLSQDLRFSEARFQGKKILTNQNWQASGMILFADGTVNPWYLAEYRTSIYNGTLSSKDVAPTRIRPNKMFDIVVSSLPNCEVITQEEDSPHRQKPEQTSSPQIADQIRDMAWA
jgi:hypothetical protein